MRQREAEITKVVARLLARRSSNVPAPLVSGAPPSGRPTVSGDPAISEQPGPSGRPVPQRATSQIESPDGGRRSAPSPIPLRLSPKRPDEPRESSPGSQTAEPPGHIGPFRIIGKLGSGILGPLWLAYRDNQGPVVALRQLSDELANSPAAVSAFYAEYRIAAGLGQPHAMRLHELAEFDGTHALSQEWIDGSNLNALLNVTAPSPAVAARLCLNLLDALSASNKLQEGGAPLSLVHGNLSASSIMLTHEGRLVLSDFGTARITAQLPYTAHELEYGKACFIAPEQVRGEVLGEAADIYGVGVLLWTLLTGRFPFDPMDATETHDQIQVKVVPAASQVRHKPPPAFDAICRKAMAKLPDRRYSSALDMSEALSDAIRAADCLATPDDLKKFAGSTPELDAIRAIIDAHPPARTAEVSTSEDEPEKPPASSPTNEESSPSANPSGPAKGLHWTRPALAAVRLLGVFAAIFQSPADEPVSRPKLATPQETTVSLSATPSADSADAATDSTPPRPGTARESSATTRATQPDTAESTPAESKPSAPKPTDTAPPRRSQPVPALPTPQAPRPSTRKPSTPATPPSPTGLPTRSPPAAPNSPTPGPASPGATAPTPPPSPVPAPVAPMAPIAPATPIAPAPTPPGSVPAQ